MFHTISMMNVVGYSGKKKERKERRTISIICFMLFSCLALS